MADIDTITAKAAFARFQAVLAGALPLRDENALRKFFLKCSQDKQYLRVEDLRRMLSILGLDAEHLSHLFRWLNYQNSGLVSWTEFNNMVGKYDPAS